ncbi:hypothetical protein GCM10009789_54020 [Kribbella sancticallisti]|uniref:Uncharacterized protein n=1 Tax=Kribbella sancticallisti TaxID=460087 RepID=A0ABP4Q054_9ACTN
MVEAEPHHEPGPSMGDLVARLTDALPRAQYVAFTASRLTPALMNPDVVDHEFPRDFIVSMPRPEGYLVTSGASGAVRA